MCAPRERSSEFSEPGLSADPSKDVMRDLKSNKKIEALESSNTALTEAISRRRVVHCKDQVFEKHVGPSADDLQSREMQEISKRLYVAMRIS